MYPVSLTLRLGCQWMTTCKGIYIPSLSIGSTAKANIWPLMPVVWTDFLILSVPPDTKEKPICSFIMRSVSSGVQSLPDLHECQQSWFLQENSYFEKWHVSFIRGLYAQPHIPRGILAVLALQQEYSQLVPVKLRYVQNTWILLKMS